MRRDAASFLQPGHQLTLLEYGQALFPAMEAAIDESRHEVRLETYIYEFDAAGERIAHALMRAALRGVKVFLMVDGAGTGPVPAQWAARLRDAGVELHVFLPMGALGLLIPSRWWRLHRKLCVVDGRLGFCGGINVLDDLHDPVFGRLPAPRLDFAVQVSGPLVQTMQEVMAQFWWRAQLGTQVREADLRQGWQTLGETVRASMTERISSRAVAGAAPGVRAALLLRDNVFHRYRIERAYRKAIGEARTEIILANAYFLPGRKLRQALIHAARRGVRVRLLLQGRYEYFLQYHAVRMVYGALLKAGVEIHEYAPSFLHAKVAVIDSQWATVGSSNLDPLSLLLAREANIVVSDGTFAQRLRARLLDAMTQAGRLVDSQAFARRRWLARMLDALAYGLVRAMLFLTGKRY